MRRPHATIIPWHERLFGPSPWGGKKGTAGKAAVILAALVFSACFAVVFYAKQASARVRFLDTGFYAVRNGDFSNAVTSLKQATALDPTNARAFSELGTAYDAQGQGAEALTAWAEAVRLNPDMYEPYIARGIHYYKARDFEASLKDFSRAVQLRPSLESHFQKGLALQALGQHQQAIDSFDQALAQGGLKDPVIEGARKVSVEAMEAEPSN